MFGKKRDADLSAIKIYLQNFIKVKQQAVFLVILTLSILYYASAATASGLNVHFLNVGQGLSILVEADGEYMIYDGGGRESSSFVVSYLKKQGVEKLSYMVCSHYDEDHICGLIGCLSVFQTDNVIAPNYVHDSDLYESFMEKAPDITYPNVGDIYQLGDAQFTILAPTEISDDSNNNSIVIKLTYGDTGFLFLGDAEYAEEEQMLSAGEDLTCNVICPAHHGSSDSTSTELLDASKAAVAVISCGENNQYGHPHAETMEKLEDYGIQVFRTDKQGTVIASSDGETISWSDQPCNDYSAGNIVEPENNNEGNDTSGAYSSGENGSSTSYSYVVNINTKVFHYLSCSSVSQMKEKNKWYYEGTRDELIAQEYKPCGNCNP